MYKIQKSIFHQITGLPVCVTGVLPVCYRCVASGLCMGYQCVTSGLPVCYRCVTSVLPVCYRCVTGGLPVGYQWIVCVLPMCCVCCAAVHEGAQLAAHPRHQTPSGRVQAREVYRLHGDKRSASL